MINTNDVENEFGSSRPSLLLNQSQGNNLEILMNRHSPGMKATMINVRKVQPAEVVTPVRRQTTRMASMLSLKLSGTTALDKQADESDDESNIGREEAHNVTDRSSIIAAPSITSNASVIQQRAKLFSLPKKSSSRPWLSYLLFPVASICFEKRLDQLFLLSGKEAKAGLINEMSTHILIECLLLTITAQPIYNNQLEMTTVTSKIACCLFYCTFHLELISILLHGILVFSLVEVMSVVVPEWGLRRKAAILFVARLHMVGLTFFFLCSIVWPISIFSKNDSTYYFAEYVPVVAASVIPWLFVLGMIGSTYHSGLFDILYPMIKLDLHPNNDHFRELVEADIASFQKVCKDNDINTNKSDNSIPEESLNSFLSSNHLSHLYPLFAGENIHSISAIIHLDNEDYRQLGISLGDRTRLQSAVFAVSS